MNDRSIVPVRRDRFKEPSSNVRSEVGRSRAVVPSFSSSSSCSSCGGSGAGDAAVDGWDFVELEGGGDVGREGVREGTTGCD